MTWDEMKKAAIEASKKLEGIRNSTAHYLANVYCKKPTPTAEELPARQVELDALLQQFDLLGQLTYTELI